MGISMVDLAGLSRMTPRSRRVALIAASGPAALLVGIGIVYAPLLGMAACGLLVWAASTALYPGYLARVFLAAAGVLLLGYALLGPVFSHIGAGPVYLGEMVLGIGVLSLPRRHWFTGFNSIVIWNLIAFMAWGALRTLPFVPAYGSYALRDAVLWAYAAFALLLVPLLCDGEPLRKLTRAYSRAAVAIVIWTPIGLLITRSLGSVLPVDSSTGIALAVVKAGDAAIHLAGIAAFFLLRLDGGVGKRSGWRRAGAVGLALCWLAAFGVVAATSRGGMLAILVAIGAVLAFRLRDAAPRVATVAALGLTLGIVVAGADVAIDIGYNRQVSVAQLGRNFESIASTSSHDQLDATKQWRIMWWNKIIGYTIDGPYFWTGKGFGVNLADDDGFQTHDRVLRSPHNANMTVLARSGVPGLALWVSLQLTFGAALLRTIVRARAAGERVWEARAIWVLAYWLAMLANASFDVYLEGPQGGIWFWCVIALGIAVSQGYARGHRT